ncbi:hypothetical protein Tco_0387060 [Tanacetum coccineum]
MSTLKFVDTHNMIAFLSKHTESEGFEKVVDFLNATPIKYTRTVNPTIYTLCIEQFWATIKAKTVIGEVRLQALVDGKKVIITESTVRRDLQLEDAEGVDCLPKAAIFKQLTLMGSKTTAWNEFSSTIASAVICIATNQMFNFSKYIFESMVKNLDNVGKFLMYPRFVQVFLNKQVDEMSKHNGIYVTPSHTKKIFGNMKRVGKGFSGRETPLFPTIMVQAQEEMGEVDEAIYEEMDDSLERATTTATSLDAEQDRGVNIPRSDEDSLKLKELMELCTNLKNRVIDLEKTKTSQAQEITSLKRRVRRLKKKGGSRTHKLKILYKVGLSARVESSKESLGEEDASKQGRIFDIDADVGISLVSTHFDADTDMFRVHDLVGDEVIVETKIASKDVNLSVDEVILAQALAALKSAKPKADKVVIQELKQGTITTTTAATTITTASTRPKAKSLVIHEEEQAPTPTPIVSSGQGLQDEFDEEDRLTREKDEANVALTKEWNDIQARIDVDYQRKHFAAKRVEEKRNRPPTKAQQRSIMCTYLKNMEGWKPKSLKNKSFANIQEFFDKAFKRVNIFVDYRTELVEKSSKRIELVEKSSKKAEVMEESSKKAKAEIAQESSSKRAGEELEQESSKKQKVEEDKESKELKQCLEINLYDGDDCDEMAFEPFLELVMKQLKVRVCPHKVFGSILLVIDEALWHLGSRQLIIRVKKGMENRYMVTLVDGVLANGVFLVIHQPPQQMSIQDMEDLKKQYLDEMKTLINGKDYRNGKLDIEIKIDELKHNFNGMSIEIRKKEKQL